MCLIFQLIQLRLETQSISQKVFKPALYMQILLTVIAKMPSLEAVAPAMFRLSVFDGPPRHNQHLLVIKS